jgi:hypothetical protein
MSKKFYILVFILLSTLFTLKFTLAQAITQEDGDEYVTDGYTMFQRDAVNDKFFQLIEKNDHKLCLLKYPGIINYDKRDIISYWRCRQNVMQDRLDNGNFKEYDSRRINSYIGEFIKLSK